MPAKRILMLMVDGFGHPPEGWNSSIYRKFCGPDFARLLEKHSVPIDASLGVEGLPQSATSQTSLFTGINAAKIVGRHIQGFPGKTLREIIGRRNIFKTLIEKGRKVAFSNAYVRYSLEELQALDFRSVTTVMVHSTLGWARNMQDLIRGEAVYHDITCETISDKAGIRMTSPQEAARNLAGISSANDFTLFEYFLTDRAGHGRDMQFLSSKLAELGNFFTSLLNYCPKETIVILTGDHGNCEDVTVRTHTRNPVPLFVYGSPVPSDVERLEGIYSYVINLLGLEENEEDVAF